MIVSILLLILVLVFFTFINIMSNGKVKNAIGKEKIINNGGINIHYNVSGHGEKIILVASAGRPVSDFNELIETLNNAGFSTIAVEHRGIKNSKGTNYKNINLFDLAEDIEKVIDQETKQDEKVILIGHAFGNRIVRSYSSMNGNKVSSLILIQSGGQVPPRDQKATNALFNSFYTFLPKFWRTKQVKYAFFADNNDVPKHWISGWHISTARMQGKAVKNTDINKYISGGSAPMLIIQGKNDRIAPPENATILKDKFKDRVQVVMIDSMGHAGLPEQPESISKAILDFLD